MGVWNKMKSYRTALHDSKLFMGLANNSHLCRWCCGPYIPSAAASILQPGRVLRQRYTHRTPFWHPTVVIVDRYNLEVRFFVKPARRHCYGISLVIRCGELPREKKPAVRGRNWQNASYNRSGALLAASDAVLKRQLDAKILGFCCVMSCSAYPVWTIE